MVLEWFIKYFLQKLKTKVRSLFTKWTFLDFIKMSKIKKFKKSLKRLEICMLHNGYKNLENPGEPWRDLVERGAVTSE